MNEQQNSNNIDKSKSTHRTGHYRPVSRVNPAYLDKLKGNSSASPSRPRPILKPSTPPPTASPATSTSVPSVTPPAPSHAKSESNTKNTKKSKTRSKIIVVLNILLILSLMTGIVFLYIKYAESHAMVSKLSTAEGQQEFNKKELYAILADMRRLVELPSGEEPSIATMVNVDKVKNIEFYNNAQNGDRVVEYSDSKIRYIYRPSNKTIINVESFVPEPSPQQ